MKFRYLLLLCLPFMFFCKASKEGKNSTAPSLSMNMQYVQRTDYQPDPRMGGPDFIQFVSETEANLKIGDVMYQANYHLEGLTIIIEVPMIELKRIYTYVDENTLKDEFNLEWVLEAN